MLSLRTLYTATHVASEVHPCAEIQVPEDWYAICIGLVKPMPNKAYLTKLDPTEPNRDDISHFFEKSGLQILRDGLVHVSFGEYLVSQQAISREDLFRSLQLQDQNPGVKLGECLAKLGAMNYEEIEKHLKLWNCVSVVEA